MPANREDFWPSAFPTVQDESPPVALLTQQAELLAGKTGNHVQGVVRDSVIEGTVYHSLYLRAPALGDYMFKILSLSHPVTKGGEDPFPLNVRISVSHNTGREINNMEEFEDWLKHVLSMDEVQATVANLIRQSNRVSSES